MAHPNRMRRSFLLLSWLLPLLGSAQTKDTIYRRLNATLEIVPADEAVFVAKAWPEAGNWTAYIYDLSGKLAIVGHFKDKSLKIRDGRFVTYNELGKLELEGHYVDGRRSGPWVTNYDNYIVKDSTNYREGQKQGISLGWHDNGQRRFVGQYDKGEVVGAWMWFHRNGTPSTKEEYLKGKLNKLECFDSSGNLTGQSCPINTEPAIKGRYGGIQKYIVDSLIYPKEALKRGIQGTVGLEFTVTKDGKAGKFKVLETPDPLLSDEVIRLISSVPAWYPAIEHNQVVDYTMRIFVPFNLPETYRP
jgi:TonB family protein